MKNLLFILCLFVAQSVAAQDSISLKKAMADLDNALLSKDSAALARLLDENVVYGHSSGWTENKKEVISDLKTGFLVYERIQTESTQIDISKKFATVRMRVLAKGSRDGKSFELILHVLQVWMTEGRNWKLIARQSAKLDK